MTLADFGRLARENYTTTEKEMSQRKINAQNETKQNTKQNPTGITRQVSQHIRFPEYNRNVFLVFPH